MKKILLFSLIALLLASATFFACSSNKEMESKKGSIETVTDKTAKKLAEKMLSPIKKARSVKNQQEDRFNDMEGNVKEQ